MTPQLLNLNHSVDLTPVCGGLLVITSVGNGVDYDLRISDRLTGEPAEVRIEGDGLLELLELVASILSTVIECGDPSEDRDTIDLSDLEQGEELYAVYCPEDEGEDATPEGLVIEAIEELASKRDSSVLVALSELPQLQMQITMLMLSGLGR